ncbi:recombinase family protein [Caenimonas sp. DR4.4]|uniref:Recombinase family protein n=2 Tax=Caenimonas aquaedulcis TaxID=2793270 RepID=A0A931MHQ6_9BURK|nr:recombinase family protein [Caenimonas aquaedulcis]
MSTDKQDLSPQIQKAAIESYARKCGLDILVTYEDDGRSGVHLSNRPALTQLIKDVTTSPSFGVVLVYDVSRWGRFQNADASAYYEYHCILHGVQVIYVAETFANDHTPMSALVKSMKRTMAAEYSRELATKVVAGQRRVIDMGFVMGPPPSLGYRRQSVSADGSTRTELRWGQRKGALTDRVEWVLGPDPEVALVRTIFSRYAAGHSVRDIVASLLKEGCHDQAGRPISLYHIRHLLRNEAVIGIFVWGRPHAESRMRLVEGERMRVAGRVPQIVDDATWELVQNRLRGSIPKKRSLEEMIQDLEKALSRNPSLRSADLGAEGCAPLSAYKNCFGTWQHALMAAGADPSVVAANLAERRRVCRNLVYVIGHALLEALAAAKVQASFSGRTNILKILGYSIRVRLAWQVVRPCGRSMWEIENHSNLPSVSHTLYVRVDKLLSPRDYLLVRSGNSSQPLPSWVPTLVPQALQKFHSPTMRKLVKRLKSLA